MHSCSNPHKARGLCESHYHHERKRPDFDSNFPCRLHYRPSRMSMEQLALWALKNASRQVNGCHLWSGQHNGLGYGQLSIRRKNVLIHRVVFEVCNGEIPEGLVIRHTCDTPSCICPSHLISGTHADNARDRVERGQQVNGERHGRSKLTVSDVVAIRQLVKSGRHSQQDIAATFGVSRATVYKIANRLKWKHV